MNTTITNTTTHLATQRDLTPILNRDGSVMGQREYLRSIGINVEKSTPKAMREALVPYFQMEADYYDKSKMVLAAAISRGDVDVVLVRRERKDGKFSLDARIRPKPARRAPEQIQLKAKDDMIKEMEKKVAAMAKVIETFQKFVVDSPTLTEGDDRDL